MKVRQLTFSLLVFAEAGRIKLHLQSLTLLGIESAANATNVSGVVPADNDSINVSRPNTKVSANDNQTRAPANSSTNASTNASANDTQMSAFTNVSANASAGEALGDKFMDRVSASVGRTLAKGERALAEADQAQAKANHTLTKIDGNESTINETRSAIGAMTRLVNRTTEAHREARDSHRDARQDHRDFRDALKGGACEAVTVPKYSEVCPKLETEACIDYEPHCTWVRSGAPLNVNAVVESNASARDATSSDTEMQGNGFFARNNTSIAA